MTTRAIAFWAVTLAACPATAASLLVGPDGRGATLADGELRDAADGSAVASRIDAAAFTDDGVLWAVSGTRLGWIDEGRFDGAIELPAPGCRLAAGAGRLVIACPREATDDLYVLDGDGGYRYLFTVDRIDAMSVTRAGILIASSGTITHVRPGDGGVVEPVAATIGTVRAACVDAAAPVLYVLADGRARALVDGRSVVLVDAIEDLACRDGDLYLLGRDGSIRVLPGAGRALVSNGDAD